MNVPRPIELRRRPGLVARTAIVYVASLVALLVVFVPIAGFIQETRRRDGVAEQMPPSEHFLTDAEAARFVLGGDFSTSGPIVLNYHRVEENPDPDDRYAVSVEAFARQLEMLDSAGFTSISVDQFARFMETGEAPERSIFITFDDGTKSLWTHVDPILEEYGFTAVAFVIVGSVGENQPYYLSWEELELMARSGRWAFGSHTYAGHKRVQTGSGEPAPFLLNRAWLDDLDRLETLDEWHQRVTEDLDASIRGLEERGFPKPRLFSYPFSAVVEPSNDPLIADTLAAAIADRFDASFSNLLSAGPVLARDAELGHVVRIGMFSGVDEKTLFEWLQPMYIDSLASPLASEHVGRWVDGERSRVPAEWFEDGTFTSPGSETERSTYVFAPARTRAWNSYEVEVVVGGLGGGGFTTSGAITVLVGSDRETRISVSSAAVRIDEGRMMPEFVTSHEIPQGSEHRLLVRVDNNHLSASVDGVEVYVARLDDAHPTPTGGIGLSVYRPPGENPSVRFSELQIRSVA